MSSDIKAERLNVYRVRVVETRDYSVDYEILATSEDEAREMAESGDTIAEEECNLVGVTNRQVVSTEMFPNLVLGNEELGAQSLAQHLRVYYFIYTQQREHLKTGTMFVRSYLVEEPTAEELRQQALKYVEEHDDCWRTTVDPILEVSIDEVDQPE